MKRMHALLRASAIGLALPTLVSPAMAHDPILSCFDAPNNSITCEAGYSDGAAASGQTIRVMLANKRLVLEDKFARNSAFTFKKPTGDFIVEFIGDAAHHATFDSEDLGK